MICLPVVCLCFCLIAGSAAGVLPTTNLTPSSLVHRPHELRSAYPRLEVGVGTAKPWVEMTSRQAPPAAENTSTSPLQAFSADVPLLGPAGRVVGAGTPAGYEGIEMGLDGAAAPPGCQVTLGVHVFGTSYGQPFVGNYTPPECLGDSDTVVMNLTVQSQGRQFDRLAIV